MDAYQKSVADVDVALQRLNATLASYRISSTNKPTTAAPEARGPALRVNSSLPSNARSSSADRPSTPQKVSGSSFDALRERPHDTQDKLWQEVLKVRCVRSRLAYHGLPPSLREISVDQLQSTLEEVSQIHERYLVEYPYLIPLRILLSQKYLQLGYPDLAAGEAYKALLLCDAIQDTADEYHGSAASQLRDLIQQIPLVERIRLLKGELHGDKHPPAREPDEDMDVEVDVWIREHYLPWAYRLLSLGLVRCGCFRSGRQYAWDSQTKGYSGDQWLLDISSSTRNSLMEHLGLSRAEMDDSIYDERQNWPDQGYVRREIYPWNEWEPDRIEDLPVLNGMMAEVAPKLEIRAVELPILASSCSSDRDALITQLGVFAKEDITPGEVILDETSMLTANNKLQEALCDACSADLPPPDSTGASLARECPHCDAVFCSQKCLERAEESYHVAVCGADLDALLRDVPPKEAADSLYALLLLRAIAMAETQDCHPLELKELKYIWGDFHTVLLEEHFQPPSCTWEGFENVLPSDKLHGNLPRTLPFSFEHNIRLPLQMLEKMEIDPFAEPKYDLWVINTLYAKFRGTASARLSGLGGRAIRGPEVSAVHPMWCMANHSCDPNVSWEWGGSIKFWTREERVVWKGADGRAVVRNSAGIKKGEEVLNHYCDVDLPVKERREWARGALGGDCMCERCVWEAEQGRSTKT